MRGVKMDEVQKHVDAVAGAIVTAASKAGAQPGSYVGIIFDALTFILGEIAKQKAAKPE